MKTANVVASGSGRMRVGILANPRSDHQRETAEALAAGLRKHDVECRVTSESSELSQPIVACWGWRKGAHLQQMGKRVLVMERAYLGDRFRWVSLGWDGLNGRAHFPQVDDGGERFRRHFDGLLRPERREAGAYVLLLGQVVGDASLRGVDVHQFYRNARRAVEERYHLPVVFRPHPVEVKRGRVQGDQVAGMQLMGGTLEEALESAHCAVAYNSNSLTDAALAGVPVLAADEGAMVWPIAGRGLQDMARLSDRSGWAHRMAWCQWLPEEIASGAAWECLFQALPTHENARSWSVAA